ncbi:MAG: serine hydrolase [SAR86 cluster bacterium]|uniref:Serine hydrolase n=1 Tax=SAR86 cluster bacterium TaxID=2030880 RepID=A0A2A5B5S4_9GAMM|nr:MAG: serine hydrolase [SAR86 cluster bacterium]
MNKFLLSALLITGSILPDASIQAQTDSDVNEVAERLALAGLAKRYCSGIWVSQRENDEALENSVLLGSELTDQYHRGELGFDIDSSSKVITATRNGVASSARHFGDQGCVILRPDSINPLFTPREVLSTLPNATTTAWPMGDLLPTAPLASDIDIALLDQASDTFFSNEQDRRAAFLVIHKGKLIKETYGSGAHKDMQLESWSMAKSMTATLIGRLIQMGHLELNDPAPIPQWQLPENDPRADIRIADLLRMSSGIRFSGGGATPEQMSASYIPGQQDHLLGYAAPINIFHFSANQDAEFPRNTVGRYRNSDPWILGYVVRRLVENTLGEEYLTWPQRELFDKIGIRRFIAETDIYGNFILSGYNYGTARDWARLGLLYLNGGVANGERLLPEEFVDFVQSPAPAWDRPIYGGQFWLNPADDSGVGIRRPSLPTDTYHAAGAGDQNTYIIPSRDLVIVVMSHRSGANLMPDRWKREEIALGLAVKAVDPSWVYPER